MTSFGPKRPHRRRGMGISLRFALLSWLVAMATLLVFLLVTVPQQKRTFLKNLESKANSVAVSLHEAAAGAAVNEDFASVVSASSTMVNGDRELDFLVVVKQDRYSLIIEKSGWKTEPRADEYWLPSVRQPVGQIAVVPVLNRRVFHYAQPFDYSGIRWGWIHVGLSLEGYDRSVAELHRNTLLLALGCVAFSFLISLLYARQMVRPILRLRRVVQEIAGGDLSVRAEKVRNDELGSLAESVNSMAESLLRRDRILESVSFAAQNFLQASRMDSVMDDVLCKIGQASEVGRAYVFENHVDDAGFPCTSQRVEWTAAGCTPQLPNPELQAFRYAEAGFGRWSDLLGRNEILCGPVAEMDTSERPFLESQGIRSLIVVPVFVDGQWWGFLGLDDCVQERQWTDAVKDSLRAIADMIGSTIARQRVQDALVEAKATLEKRVVARTQELLEQVGAKEKALDELAAAQSSLVQISRTAGMAEVATGVLHNVGNVLNSVNVSCTLLLEQLQESRVGNVSKVASLLSVPEGDLARFLTEDATGRKIPVYLTGLSAALEEEHRLMLRESESLRERVEHIKEIVAMQQSYGRALGVMETMPAEQLIEDAVKLNAEALTRHGVVVRRNYQSTEPITVDKHKVLQILLNLINNAKYALADGNGGEKTITLALRNSVPGRIRIQVSDNGVGIPPENLTRIFQHGFTTRKTGHGFGLHSGANAARELGGSLTVQSDGPGKGATFTLEFPIRPGESA